MPNERYRTGSTSLSDDELLILDEMFDAAVIPRMLLKRNFKAQFNSEPHSLDDYPLYFTLRRLVREGIIAPCDHEFRGQRYLRMTSHGGELWSRERTPIWQRFCRMTQIRPSHGRDFLTVTALSDEIRDDCLRLVPEYAAWRATVTISDFGLIQWRTFDNVHVGFATFQKPRLIGVERIQAYIESHESYIARLDQGRTWWRTVNELQRFVPV